VTEDRLCRRNALLAPMLRPQSRPYLSVRALPPSLPSERPSRPVGERSPAKPS